MQLIILPKPVLMVLALLLLSGCSAWKVNNLADQLQTEGAVATLEGLEAINPPDRDLVQYLLDRGSLKLSTGDFTGSIQDLQQAKTIMRGLQAISVTETAAAATINETLRSYNGTPSEQVMVHLAMAWNYLALNDFDGARVEMLQSNVTMQELAKNDSVSGQLASVRFLAGVIYELGGERDDAMISYRRAAAIMQARNQPIPDALATSLINTSYRQGFTEEHQGYVKQFGREALPRKSGDGEVIVFYNDGVVSTIKQRKISIYSWQLEQMISIAVPHYSPLNYHPRKLNLSLGGQEFSTSPILAGQQFSTSPIENIEVLAREDLDAAMPGIIATTTARAVAKYYSVKEAGKQNQWAGIAANIATVLTEVADTRSWNMLPSGMQIARISVPAGTTVKIVGMPPELYAEQLAPASAGATVLVFASSLRNNIYSYQQPR
jgi:hypothetical protein